MSDYLATNKIGLTCGCTAAALLIDGDNLYCANIGDANSVLIRDGSPTVLSKEHKANDPDEQKRIEDIGGLIINGKISSILSVGRAFGDLESKPYVISEPYQFFTNIKENDILIIACDGLWDVVNFEECANICDSNKKKKAKDISDILLKEALQKGTTDNVSICTLKLSKKKHPFFFEKKNRKK